MIVEFGRTYDVVETNSGVSIVARFGMGGETVLVASTTPFKAAAFVHAYIIARATLDTAPITPRERVARAIKAGNDAMKEVKE